MVNKRVKRVLLSLGMSLAIVSVASGCSTLKKDAQTEVQTETETETETKTAEETETETETETELQTEQVYTSQDKTIRITLPDSTWKVTQDADEMRVFSSGTAAMISIVHADTETQLKNLSVSESEDDLTDSLSKQYPNANAFEVEEFETDSNDDLNLYKYVVKYNATSMWAYSVTYGIIAEDEAYVVQGTVTDDNKVLLDAVQKSVESFSVLRNSLFSDVKDGKLVKSDSEEESESETTGSKDADAELKTLTDYGTTATLYSSDDVNVRATPSTESTGNIISSLSKGAQVTVVGETSLWFKVNISGNIGYVSKQFLVRNKPADTTETTAQSETSETVSSSTRISAELNSQVNYGSTTTLYATTDLNVRSQPGTDSSAIDGLGTGQAVSVIGETDNWFIVSINGNTGYISKSYVSSTPVSDNNSGNTNTDNGGSNSGNNSNSGSTTPTSGTGTISGTVTATTMNSITVAGDDGRTYTIDTSDASISTDDGLYTGLYISANVDYSSSSGSSLYATSVTGY